MEQRLLTVRSRHGNITIAAKGNDGWVTNVRPNETEREVRGWGTSIKADERHVRRERHTSVLRVQDTFALCERVTNDNERYTRRRNRRK